MPVRSSGVNADPTLTRGRGTLPATLVSGCAADIMTVIRVVEERMASVRRVPMRRGTRIEACLEPDGEGVSRLDLFDLRMCVGATTVRCGGIGSVGTSRDHRLQGYSRLVLDAGIALMRSESYHISVLFGIPDYYQRFGFACADR